MLGENIEIECHSSIKISGSKILYVDPFRVSTNYNDADYIFITHSHYDHLSVEDIKNVMKDNTKIIAPKDCKQPLLELFTEENILIVNPANVYTIDTISFETTNSYNIEKEFHQKSNDWVGYLIKLDDITYFISGDTDNIEELQNIKCDVAMIPIGGHYTMDYVEAAELANAIDSELVIPTHYAEIIGDIEDGKNFAKLVTTKEVKILI